MVRDEKISGTLYTSNGPVMKCPAEGHPPTIPLRFFLGVLKASMGLGPSFGLVHD
jgi:hypothetical protein